MGESLYATWVLLNEKMFTQDSLSYALNLRDKIHILYEMSGMNAYTCSHVYICI